MNDRRYESVLIILICSLCLFILGFIALMIDFYNDYQCSTTNDIKYWKTHNCIKYCKECKDEYNK